MNSSLSVLEVQDFEARLTLAFSGSVFNQIFAIFWLIFFEIVGNGLMYSVIWYQQFGKECNHTLINHLNSHLFAYIIVSNASNFALKMSPFLLRGPSPRWICLLQEAINFYLQVLGWLTCTEVIVLRYCYLIRWKNVGFLSDEFFNMFLLLANNMIALFNTCVALYIDGLFFPYYWICSGQMPRMAINKLTILYKVILGCGVALDCFSIFKIIAHKRTDRKRDHLAMVQQASHNPNSRQVTIIPNRGILIGIALFFSSGVPFFVFTSNVELIISYPVGLLLGLVMPQLVISTLLPIIGYIYNQDMREHNWRHFKAELRNRGLIQ